MSAIDAGSLKARRGRASSGALPSLPEPWSGRDSRRRILIATDAWYPQVNGVVRTLNQLRQSLERWNYNVGLVTPHDFSTEIGRAHV